MKVLSILLLITMAAVSKTALVPLSTHYQNNLLDLISGPNNPLDSIQANIKKVEDNVQMIEKALAESQEIIVSGARVYAPGASSKTHKAAILASCNSLSNSIFDHLSDDLVVLSRTLTTLRNYEKELIAYNAQEEVMNMVRGRIDSCDKLEEKVNGLISQNELLCDHLERLE